MCFSAFQPKLFRASLQKIHFATERDNKYTIFLGPFWPDEVKGQWKSLFSGRSKFDRIAFFGPVTGEVILDVHGFHVSKAQLF